MQGVTAVEGEGRTQDRTEGKAQLVQSQWKLLLCLQGQRWETLKSFPALGQEGCAFMPVPLLDVGMWPLREGGLILGKAEMANETNVPSQPPSQMPKLFLFCFSLLGVAWTFRLLWKHEDRQFASL